jgi:ABC-type phosphate/phosphonate transport system substrate-binding protein
MVVGKRFQMLTLMFLAWSVPGMGLGQKVQTAPSSPVTVLICYPGGAARSQDAQSATDTMLRVVEEGGDWTPGSMTSLFTTRIKECETHLDEDKPHFAITTLGTFLAYRERLDLIPLVQPVINGSSSEKYRIVVRKGTFTSIEELKGKTLGGSFVEETLFLKRVILQGKVDPASFFILKGSGRALRSLRALVKGDLDAVMVNSQQYRALGSLPFASEIAVAFTSAEVPLVGLVANGKRTTEDERNRFSQGLAKMCEHRDGRQLCELFGIERFIPADEQAFKTIITLWSAP